MNFRTLAKVDLHLHLDGAVRTRTILDLARRAGVTLPARTVRGLTPHVTVDPGNRSLRGFLRKFEVFYPALQSREAQARIAYELCEDMARDGVVYFETRFAPCLVARPGVTMEDAVRGALEGLRRGGRRFNVRWGLILCFLRTRPEASMQTARLARRYLGRGVVGIDIAGDEAAPITRHEAAFAAARRWGIPITVHCGEAGPAGSVLEAIERYGARRIGHGVRLASNPGMARRAARLGAVLEVCLTSNVQTGAARSLDRHPLPRLRALGVPVTINSDDPAVSRITLSGEYGLAQRAFGMTRDDFVEMLETAVAASFASPARKREVLRRIHRSWGNRASS